MVITEEEKAEWWQWVRGESRPPASMGYRDAICKLLHMLDAAMSTDGMERLILAERIVAQVRISIAEKERDLPASEFAACLQAPTEYDASFLSGTSAAQHGGSVKDAVLEWARRESFTEEPAPQATDIEEY